MTATRAAPALGSGLGFLPLGGAGEIGMNLYLYHCDGKWLMVDLGVTFGDDSLPSVDVVMPDPAFIVDRRKDLLALLLTHAHEDHLGAVPYLWSRLGCPIYATRFAAGLLRAKLREEGIEETAPIRVVAGGETLELGPFRVGFVGLTHSTPEMKALVLRTPHGTVLHTGDWKLDPDPVVGEASDEEALRRLGAEGVLALVCDSTNVFRPGVSGSEAALEESLVDLVGGYKERVTIACFASNIARLKTIAAVARATGRHASLVGRSLWRMNEIAAACGYFDGLPSFLSPREARDLPRRKVLYVCTGSQGEPKAALARIAAEDHPHVVLEAGDAVIFSSRMIPGYERRIARLQGKLLRLGVEIVTEADHFVHVSGHPFRDELARMYEWVKPRIAIPMHGETHHLVEHARLASDWGTERTLIAEDGELVRLAPGEPAVTYEVHSGRLAVDGSRLLALDGEAFRSRQRAVFEGAVALTLVIDGEGNLVADPKLAAPGLLAPEDEVRRVVQEAVREAIESLPRPQCRDNDLVADAASRALRRALFTALGRKPIAEVQIIRL